MGLQVDPPFGLGQTLLGFSATQTSVITDSLYGLQSSASYGDQWAGAVKEFTDVVPSTGTVRTNRRKVCVCVKNASGGSLLPKRVVTFSTTAGKLFGEVTGYSAATNEERVGIVDEFLPASGVSANDYFWVTVSGPSEVAGALSGTDIAVGDRVAAITAATSGATTAGRVTPVSVANATGLGVIGYATSVGATTGSSPLCLIVSKFG